MILTRFSWAGASSCVQRPLRFWTCGGGARLADGVDRSGLPIYPCRMASPLSDGDGWDFVVPSGGEDLWAELRRRGVRPGQRVHLSIVRDADHEQVEDVRSQFGSDDPG